MSMADHFDIQDETRESQGVDCPHGLAWVECAEHRACLTDGKKRDDEEDAAVGHPDYCRHHGGGCPKCRSEEEK